MASDPITVSLGDMAENARRHLATGEYDSLDDVVREGIRALDREQAAYTAYLREKIAEALADPRPSIPLDEAFAQILAAPRKPLT